MRIDATDLGKTVYRWPPPNRTRSQLHIDTTTPAGRMLLQMLGAVAEFERSMVRERTRLGLQAARERGRVGGRSPKLSSHQRAEAIKMVESGTKSAAEVARLFRVHRSSISRLMSQARITE